MIPKLIMAACLFIATNTFAQDLKEKNVPSVVLNSLSKAFPKAEKVEWEMEGNYFNAEFQISRREHELWLNSRGMIIKHQQELRTDQLPEIVRNGARKYFKGYRIDELYKVELARKFYYKLSLRTFTDHKHAVFNHKGDKVDLKL